MGGQRELVDAEGGEVGGEVVANSRWDEERV